MNDLNDVNEVAAKAAETGTLDVTGWPITTHAHADLLSASVLAWWVLAGSTELTLLRLPERGQEVFHRSGLVTACERRRVRCEVVPTREERRDDALVGDESWDRFIAPSRPDDFVTIGGLADPSNRPPEPDEHGSRYLWVGGLIGEQREKLAPRLRRLVASDADRCLYEFVDNVHRWAQATSAIATVAMTRGGGGESFDRLHIVVMDSGRGIISSVLDDPKIDRLPPELADDPKSLLYVFLKKAFGDRQVPRHNGHGLHVAHLLSREWIGRIDLLSADHRQADLVHRARNTVNEGIQECTSFELAGARGTLVELTFNLVASDAHRELIEGDERAEQDELFPQPA